MYTSAFYLLLVAVCMSPSSGFDIVEFEKNLKQTLQHTALHHIYEAREHMKAELEKVLVHHQQRSVGKDLLHALEGSAINSLTTATTGVVTQVVDKAISGLTSALTGGITKLIGHLGKRNSGKDLLNALEGAALNQVTTAATGLVGNLVTKLTSGLTSELTHLASGLFSHIGKRSSGKDLLKALEGAALTSVENSLTPVIDNAINTAVTKLTDEVGHVATNLLGKIHFPAFHLGKRNIFKDLLHGIEQSVVGIEQSALSSLTGIASEKLNQLIGKLGKRDVDLMEMLSGVMKGFESKIANVVENTLSGLPSLFEKELSTLLTGLGE